MENIHNLDTWADLKVKKFIDDNTYELKIKDLSK